MGDGLTGLQTGLGVGWSQDPVVCVSLCNLEADASGDPPGVGLLLLCPKVFPSV